MEKDQRNGHGVVVKGRATIDSRPPFGSVKEAVALFGERVVGQIYAKQLKQMQEVTKVASEKEEDVTSSTLAAVSTELEETKQKLQKTIEEGNRMANSIKSLKQELEETKRELKNLKATKQVVKDHHHQPKLTGINNPEIEEFKFVEINHNLDINNHGIIKDNNNNNNNNDDDDDYYCDEQAFQKKKAVTFASPPSLTREINKNGSMGSERGSSKFGRAYSFRKEGNNKKSAVAIMGWLFPKKKRGYQGDHIHIGSPQN